MKTDMDKHSPVYGLDEAEENHQAKSPPVLFPSPRLRNARAGIANAFNVFSLYMCSDEIWWNLFTSITDLFSIIIIIIIIIELQWTVIFRHMPLNNYSVING